MEEVTKAEPCSANERGRIETTLAEINEFIKYREHYLCAYEKLLMKSVLRQEITLMNSGSQKKAAILSSRLNGNLQLDAKIIRRNLFFLHQRKAKLVAELNAMTSMDMASKETQRSEAEQGGAPVKEDAESALAS